MGRVTIIIEKSYSPVSSPRNLTKLEPLIRERVSEILDGLPVGPGSGLMVQRCGFFVAPIREHLQEMGLIIPTLAATDVHETLSAGDEARRGVSPGRVVLGLSAMQYGILEFVLNLPAFGIHASFNDMHSCDHSRR
jgi:hypothetical protein